MNWINQSQGSLSDADATKIIEALNIQVADLARAWPNVDPQGIQHVLTASPAAGQVKAYFLPNADVANALGYHDVDPQGDPYIRVFTETVLSAGGTVLSGPASIAVCASHEACEEACDPQCDDYSPPEANGKKVAIEVSDPVESSGYDVTLSDGSTVTVSDFVFPSFFDTAGQAPYDQMNLIRSPFQILSGGYEIVEDPGGNVTQIFGDNYASWRARTKEHPASRTYRRLHKKSFS